MRAAAQHRVAKRNTQQIEGRVDAAIYIVVLIVVATGMIVHTVWWR